MYNNQNRVPTPKTFFKTLSLIHIALIFGLVLFGVVAYSITKTNSPIVNSGPDVFLYIVPSLALIGVFAGSFFFKQQRNKIPEDSNLTEKLPAYQTASIMRYALAEGPALFGIVAYLQSPNLLYLLISGLLVLYFIWIGPKKDKIEQDLSLSYEDKIEMGF